MDIQEGLRLEMVGEEEPSNPSEETENQETQEDSPEQTAAESAEAATSGQETTESVEKVPYTIDEMRNADPDKIDTSRIPPEMLPFYKAMQAPVTRKSQQLSELEKQYAEWYRQQSLQPPQPNQAQTYANADEYFKAQPEKFLDELDDLILSKKQADPLDPEIVSLEARKAQYQRKFRTETQERQRQFLQMQQMNQVVQQELARNVPDYNADLRDKLTNYAVTDLGYTMEEVVHLTNPLVQGPLAVKNLKRIHDAYKASLERQEIPKKQAKKTPNKVEKAGSGFDTDKPAPITAEEMIAERMKRAIW